MASHISFKIKKRPRFIRSANESPRDFDHFLQSKKRPQERKTPLRASLIHKPLSIKVVVVEEKNVFRRSSRVALRCSLKLMPN